MVIQSLVQLVRWCISIYIYLVDPASSYMLVSKIKPCMSLYIPWNGKTANGSLNQLSFLRLSLNYKDNCSNSRANTCQLCPDLTVWVALLEQNQPSFGSLNLLTLDKVYRSHDLASATCLSNV